MGLTPLLVMFVTGLIGSLSHCVGMCGGFVAAISFRVGAAGGAPPRTVMTAQALYNAGRITTYALLGGALGWAGAGFNVVGRWLQVQDAMALLAGCVMVWMGLSFLVPLPSLPWIARPWERLTALLGRVVQRALSPGRAGGAYPMGCALGLLPCCFLWAAEAQAAGTGSFGAGAASMLAFGLGTAPALLGLGWVTARLSERTRGRLLKVAAAMIILMGLWYLGLAIAHFRILHNLFGW